MVYKKGVTVCILAKDEEKNIADCINSVLSFADEIILVDNGSKDRTKDIASRLGAKVYTIVNCSEASLRNFSLSKASYLWTFSIDADERATPEFGKALKMEIEKSKDNIVAFEVPINSYYGGGLWATYLLVKCVKNGVGVHYEEGDIHPSMGKSINRVGEVGIIPGEIHHLDALIKDRSSSKRNLYLNKIELEINSQSDILEQSRLKNYLGLEYTSIGEIEYANRLYADVIRDLNNHPHSNFAHVLLAQNYVMNNKFDLAKVELGILIGENYESVLFDSDLSQTIYTLESKSNLSDALLQQSLILLEKIAIKYNEKDKALYWANLALYLWPFVSCNYLNLAALLGKKNSLGLIKRALEINSYLNSKIIYKQGCFPNLYESQCSLIKSTLEII